jgi:hypothetical protein
MNLLKSFCCLGLLLLPLQQAFGLMIMTLGERDVEVMSEWIPVLTTMVKSASNENTRASVCFPPHP